MANGQHGGYREPASPAPVSGPGKLARRTDGGPGQPVRRLPDAQYGESAEFEAQQSSAAMAGSQGAPVDASGVVPMGAPTQHPGQPVTEGAVYGQPDNGATNQDDLLQAGAWMPVLKWKASQPKTSNSFRQLVRQLQNLQ